MLYIPEKLKVGFQNRDDTYTKKLAYVTCYDEKNKLRQELSWNGWRDTKIEPEEFTNTPIEGFVLNKKVGDYNSRWGGRRAYVRIYDPRGFEFEISVDNLIFILEKNSSIVGKGLEGSYVYSWDKNNIVLLPTNSDEYIESKKHSNAIHKNIRVTAKTIKVGNVYKTRCGDNLLYLGNHKIYYRLYFNELYGHEFPEKLKRKYVTHHVFADMKKYGDYIYFKLNKGIPRNIFDHNMTLDQSEYNEYYSEFVKRYASDLSDIDLTQTKKVEIDIYDVIDKLTSIFKYYRDIVPNINNFVTDQEDNCVSISFQKKYISNYYNFKGYELTMFINENELNSKPVQEYLKNNKFFMNQYYLASGEIYKFTDTFF